MNSDVQSNQVSVIIPLYNKGKSIERTLVSVFKQTYQPMEIIVVDDGSTDDGCEKVRSFLHPLINIIFQKNMGPGAARNTGLAKARGKYVSFLDADDEWLPTFLETGLLFLEDSKINATVACTGYIKYPEKINCIEFLKEISMSDGVYEVDAGSDIKQVSNLIVFMCTSAMIMRTDTARQWGGFFDRFKCLRGEDWHFQLKLIFNERICIITEPHCIYHTEDSDLYGGGNIVNSNPELGILDLDDLLNSCPESKRPLLIKILLRKAIGTSISIALEGHRRQAKELVCKIYPLFYADRKKVIIARILVEAAPILPYFHWIWRGIKYSLGK